MKVDLNCLVPGNVHLNNLNAPVLSVLRLLLEESIKRREVLGSYPFSPN